MLSDPPVLDVKNVIYDIDFLAAGFDSISNRFMGELQMKQPMF